MHVQIPFSAALQGGVQRDPCAVPAQGESGQGKGVVEVDGDAPRDGGISGWFSGQLDIQQGVQESGGGLSGAVPEERRIVSRRGAENAKINSRASKSSKNHGFVPGSFERDKDLLKPNHCT